jgi:hypothetical protein
MYQMAVIYSKWQKNIHTQLFSFQGTPKLKFGLLFLIHYIWQPWSKRAWLKSVYQLGHA